MKVVPLSRHLFRMVSPLALALAMTAPAIAQVSRDPADMLSMHLRTIAQQPRNIVALLGAGQAALDVGDPNAAIGFFARVEEIDARNGRAKAGLASALVMMERADDALRLFGEAVSLGVSESEVAKDRGLAYDLRGDNARAQRDYAIALRRGPDDEVTRRYALSLGITGDRERALQLLNPLLYKKDQGAWRARAFVMAMTGDMKGAEAIARAVMPASQSGTMTPFLMRLATLNPADRAHAVNFGTMPSTGQSYASVRVGDPFRPMGTGNAGDTLIPAGDPLGPRAADVQVARKAEPVSREPRRRPDRQSLALASPPPRGSVAAPAAAGAVAPGFTAPATNEPALPTRVGARIDTRLSRRIAPVDPASLPPALRGEPTVATPIAVAALPPPVAAAVVTPSVVNADVVAGGPALAALPPQAPPASLATASPAAIAGPPAEKPAFETAPPPVAFAAALPPPVQASPAAVVPPPAATVAAPVALAAVQPSPVQVAPPPTVPVAARLGRLASILAGIEPEPESTPVALPSAAALRAAQKAAQRKVADAAAAIAADKAAKDAKAAEAALARKSPPRVWVQVATGNNESGLPTTWKRIRDANATALKGQSAWSAPFKATNRLLVGPMKSAAEARALVNTLAKNGLSATTFSSEAGQEIAKLVSR